MKSKKVFDPTVDQLEKEIKRRRAREKRRRILSNMAFSLMVVAAVAVLVAMLWLPVMQVYGTSMEPILNDGDILVAIKDTSIIKRGDIVAFYYNNKVLLKRAIGFPGDVINIDENGSVYVNGIVLDEPYVSKKAFGTCDIKLPVEVPENALFVLGDHRTVSIDSRSSDIGMIYDERTIGKIVFRVWPPSGIGTINGEEQ